jgi:ABC-2 type transport system permease protein
VPGTILYSLSLAIVPAVFVAVGALTSQLSRTRRTATGLALGVFGIAFVLRMIADAGPQTEWLRWATPFGWTELMRPFTQNDAWPLLPATVTVLALGMAAVALAGRRDVGGGYLTDHDSATPRPFGLATTFGLAVRLERGVLISWCLGALAIGVACGVFAKITTQELPGDFTSKLGQYGVRGSFIDEFLGIVFLLVATLVALLPA